MKRRLGTARSSALALVGIVVLALALLATTAHAAVSIDTFDDGAQSLEAKASPTKVSGTATPSGAIGNVRDVTVERVGGSGSVKIDIDLGDSNKLSYSSDDGTTGKTWIAWDGDADNGGAENPVYNVMNVNLTTGGANGIYFALLSSDQESTIRFTVWEYSSGDTAYKDINLPNVGQDTRCEFYVPYSSFENSGAVDFASVGAIQLFIDGSSKASLDLSIDFAESSFVREFGDLPISYEATATGTPGTRVPASHMPDGLRLGSRLDLETAANNSSDASGDDTDGVDDEDGVAPILATPWTSEYGAVIWRVTKGCGSGNTCRLSGWIDWNKDGKFDTGEQVLNNKSVGDGENPEDIGLPEGWDSRYNQYYFARFRVCRSYGQCNSPYTVNVANGEVEDYMWWLGPTSTTLAQFSAERSTGGVTVRWKTVDESGLTGFNIWRGETEVARGVRLNAELIPAKAPGSLKGAEYAYLDADAPAGVAYYSLQELRNGGHHWHGPLMVEGLALPHWLYLPLARSQ